MRSEGKVSTSWQCSSSPIGFGQGFLSREQCDNTGVSPIPSWPGSSWYFSVLLTEISNERTALVCCYWQHKECWNGFHKTSSSNGSNTFSVTGRSVYSHKEIVLKELYLKWSYSFVFLAIKWFREHFESTTYISSLNVNVRNVRVRSIYHDVLQNSWRYLLHNQTIRGRAI